MFEGGAGKEFFLDCAREYELQGQWSAQLVDVGPGASAAHGSDQKLSFRSGKFVLGNLHGTYTNGGQEKTGYRWNLSAPGLTGTIHATPLRLEGRVTLSDPAGQRTVKLTAVKAKPVIVDMYLDPRIADKVRVRLLEKSYFEITNPPQINYWPLIHKGEILEVNQYLDAPRSNWEHTARWRDTFLPGSLERYEEKGKIYAIPLPYYAFVIWYNRVMFHEHGWKKPVTWDDLFALCKEIKKAGIAPMAFQGRYPGYASALYDAAYYHLAGPEQWEQSKQLVPHTHDCPANIEALQLVQTLGTKYFQAGSLGMSHTEAQQQFFLGNTAMVPCGSWLKSEMKGKIPEGFELGCFNLPLPNHDKADPSAVDVYVEPLFVMKHSKHPVAAIDFLRFMTSQREAGLFARMQDIPTAIRGSNRGNLSPGLDELTAIVDHAKATYGAVPGGGYPEYDQVQTDAMHRCIAGTQTPAQIAKYMEDQAVAVRNHTTHPNQVLVKHILQPALLLIVLAGGLLWGIWEAVRQRKRFLAADCSLSGIQRMRWHNLLLFIGPSFVIYSFFVIIPSLRAFSWSLHRWDGLTSMSEMPYVGFLNFRRLLFESDIFWMAVKNNLFLMFVIPLFVVPWSLFLSASISRGIRGSNFFRIVFFFPNLLGSVAATLLWLHVYNPKGGLVNGAMVGIGRGLTHVAAWLGMHGWLLALAHWFTAFADFAWLDSSHLYWSLIPISIWGACGFNMVLYLAAMEAIPETFYEAARIDGASPWRQFWTITLPLIWEILVISLVFMVIGGMKAFEIIWLLTEQQTQSRDHVISTYMVQTMFQEYRVGEATAMAVLLFLMILAATAATLRFTRRETVEL